VGSDSGDLVALWRESAATGIVSDHSIVDTAMTLASVARLLIDLRYLNALEERPDHTLLASR
jgi:hypothetical protein